VPFTPAYLEAAFFTDLTLEYLDGTSVVTISGPITNLSNFRHQTFADPWSSLGWFEDHWTLNMHSGTMGFMLRARVGRELDSRAPFHSLAESLFQGPELEVQFPQPVMYMSAFGHVGYDTNAITQLYPLRTEAANDRFMEKTFSVTAQGKTIDIQSTYWLPKEARGDDCRCPILRIVESRITGFTTEPIVLRGYWSQTYGNIHSQDFEHFIFEPRLEPGLSSTQLAELAAADIVQIYINGNGGEDAALILIGQDGTPRRFNEVDFGNF
jgi:hypothetical protein